MLQPGDLRFELAQGRLHPGAIKPARAEIELRVADLGYFRREQIREQN